MTDYIYEVPVKTAGSKHISTLDVGPSTFNEQINRGQLDLNCENQSGKLRCKGLSLSDAVTSTSDSQMRSGEIEPLNRRSKSSDIENKGTNNVEELLSLELSLKRLRGVEEAVTTVQDERNVLRHSDLSAFSRYDDLVLLLSILNYFEDQQLYYCYKSFSTGTMRPLMVRSLPPDVSEATLRKITA